MSSTAPIAMAMRTGVETSGGGTVRRKTGGVVEQRTHGSKGVEHVHVNEQGNQKLEWKYSKPQKEKKPPWNTGPSDAHSRLTVVRMQHPSYRTAVAAWVVRG
jgi:hypothetical protein